MQEEIQKLYGHRVRVRVCGVCISEGKILLIHHRGVGETGSLWAPPGGGVEFGETAEQALIREYREETGLHVVVREFLFVQEMVLSPLHAIELFFRVEATGGELKQGIDPEMEKGRQSISEIRYWSFENIHFQEPLLFHHVLRTVKNAEELVALRGFLR
ncbi:MAG TPA: NUDIX domain-containing protein [Cytophagaceae bacterium]|jgi:8-oxo-dGTP diphosphatase|nr:NUDIX domain-containing protein [Cytophagaceae bacterium]